MKAALTILLISSMALFAIGCSPTPVEIKTEKEKYVLEELGAKDQIKVSILDADGDPITEGLEVVFFSTDTKIIRLGQQDGSIEAKASGEANVEVEVVGTDIKLDVSVRVKIAGAIELSHEKLRLWTGQVKENVCSWVQSEKGAYIEGMIPEWASEDPTVVSVEQIPDPANDPKRNRSYVKLVGKKSGDTYILTSFGHLSRSIRVRVYDEDEEVTLAGQRLGKKAPEGEEGEEEEEVKKESKEKKKEKWKKKEK